ncbi:ABC transporter ATP-binding protein [Asticcacaulis sp. DW145]|uniref:ABC transporter ATP-binding protein n=1 Tax=Asticcacaulis currens TaxID=2984210 RepID=A0ABT5ICH5_9CAUL|nr:ABC transporter ATP-binding protein [Asticcacaulis currens]MDC7693889.1 ABC transporter ATP-binding protein [Asticcacaulis currens]BEV10165.1 ABC transporter ATP-binding protein [Asticcacaulis sp. DW145]
MTGKLAIEAKGLTKSYKIGKIKQPVLKEVNFTAYHGQVTMVMGPSGSGKSTLIAALSGLMKPDEGEVIALGESLWKKKKAKIDQFRLDHCGFIFQGFNLFPALNATQQVEQVLKYCKVKKGEAKKRAVQALTEVGLDKRLKQTPSALSGGEKQRVAIARALSKNPQLLFADEPTSALDSVSGQVVIKLLHRAAKEHGAAVIVVTHDPRLEAYADRVIHMEDGQILSDTFVNRPEDVPPSAPHA